MADRAFSQMIASAAAWLAQLVDARGVVRYALDPVSRRFETRGGFRHGRAAAVIRALAVQGGHRHQVDRARAWMQREIVRALAGELVVDWPEDPARIAGTIALAVLAGVDVMADLSAFVARHAEVARTPWHAAQCVAALGGDHHPAVAALWISCVQDLDARPFAPWTAIAARAVDDGATLERCSQALVASIRAEPPHEGGTATTAAPEIALTAITVEALAPVASAPARAACARGRRFLENWQIRAGPACGAFPASTQVRYLRGDITARALLAILSDASRLPA